MKKVNRTKIFIFWMLLVTFFTLPVFHSFQSEISLQPIFNHLPQSSYLVKAEDEITGQTLYEELIEKTSHQQPQWNHNIMNIGQAWADGYTGEGIRIAILDTGFFNSHPDLSMAGGDSVFPDDPWSNDHSGHGTHIAGILGAQTGTTYQGIAPGAELLGIKIYHSGDIDEEGYVSTDTSSVAQGIRLAMNMDSDIIVISSGLTYHAEDIYQEIQAAYAEDIMIIAASGNGNASVNYPANYSEVVAVTAIDERLNPALDIIYGQENEFAAPGVNIGGLSIPDSTYSYPYIFMSGSSQAAPHAAGLAAILMEKYDVRGEEARKIMREQADKRIGDSGLFGYGLLRYMSNDELAESEANAEELAEAPKEETEETTLGSVESEDDEEGRIVRKPISSRAADDGDEGSLAYHQTEVVYFENGGILSEDTLPIVETGGTLEVWLNAFDKLTLNESQVGEIRERNIKLVLARENVTWAIPPANLLPGKAILRFYEGAPLGVRRQTGEVAPRYTISIYQNEAPRDTYPSVMDIRFDLSQTNINDLSRLAAFYWDKSDYQWQRSESTIDGQSIIVNTRHTSAIGLYYPEQMAAVVQDEEDTEEEAINLFGIPIRLAIGLLVFALLLVILGVYLRRKSKRQ